MGKLGAMKATWEGSTEWERKGIGVEFRISLLKPWLSSLHQPASPELVRNQRAVACPLLDGSTLPDSTEMACLLGLTPALNARSWRGSPRPALGQVHCTHPHPCLLSLELVMNQNSGLGFGLAHPEPPSTRHRSLPHHHPQLWRNTTALLTSQV